MADSAGHNARTMRYSLLEYLCCPRSREDLVALVFSEKAAPSGGPHLGIARRVNAAGVVVGPLCDPAGASGIGEALARHAGTPADPARNAEVEIVEGILVSARSGDWYPVIDGIPELLPGHLRDRARDVAFLDAHRARIPADIHGRLAAIDSGPIQAEGEKHKLAELSVMEKVEDAQSFLAPGAVAPFYPHALEHSLALIRGFANAATLLAPAPGQVVLDAGCGYAWCTEWFAKLGLVSIGVEINRVYLEAGLRRMGGVQPHLVIADVENLPIRGASLHHVLGFDAFHHVPDRRKATAGFFECLVPGGRFMLVEPGADHRDAPQSRDAMDRFGTLEHGMDYEDVLRYTEGSGLSTPEELFLHVVSNVRGNASYSREELLDRSYTGWRIFLARKPMGASDVLSVLANPAGYRSRLRSMIRGSSMFRALRRYLLG